MKKILLATALLLPLLFSCNEVDEDDAQFVTRVVLSQEKVNLFVGETANVTATVLPKSLGMGVDWTVLDPDYASCENGLITGLSEGVTYVIATSTDGSKKAACMVSVNPAVRYSVSITDNFGNPVSEISGYPGMSTMLYATTTDGEMHSFEWSVDDADAAKIGMDGVMTLGAVKSTDPKYIYDVQSLLKVRTEDGYGCSVPVRSNLLNGIVLGGEFTEAGKTVTVTENSETPIAVQYEAVDGNQNVPASGVNFELGNNDNFSIRKDATSCTLVTGEGNDVSSTISISLPGSMDKFEVGRVYVEKSFPIRAFLSDPSSSTLVFKWGFPNEPVDTDISKAYTIKLFKNADCTEEEQSFDIPAELEAWNGKQPCFVFGGLKPSTKYWFKAYDTTDNLESNLVEAETDAFTVVEIPSEITSAGVALAEDFGELRWDFDSPFGAVGYFPSDNSDFSNTAVNEYRKTGAGAEKTFKSFGTALGKSRLNGWATDTNVYIHPGHLKLGTASARGWILTPEFTVPEGKVARISVTITACRYNSSQDSNWAVSVLTPAQAAVNASKHEASFDWPDATNKKVYQTVEFTGNCVWATKTVDGLELHHLDRIAFGGVKGGDGSKGRVLVNDITVTVNEIVNE